MDEKHKPATMLGLAIGDALGQPFEFSNTAQIINSGWEGDFIYGPVWGLDAGKWTDDTKMALCIAESLLDKKEFDVSAVADKYVDWVKSGDLRGIGMTCEKAIYKMSIGMEPLECGKKVTGGGRKRPSFKRSKLQERVEPQQYDTNDDLHAVRGDFCGNGTVMRCAPIGLALGVTDAIKAAQDDATMTHGHPDARDASAYLVQLVRAFADDAKLDKYETCEKLLGKSSVYEYTHVPRLVKEAMKLARDGKTFSDATSLGTRGTAHETIASAIYCFLRYDNFEESVIASVLMGGDTDTRAAIVGALAGTYYGLDGIPEKYIKGVEDSDNLIALDEKLAKMGNK